MTEPEAQPEAAVAGVDRQERRFEIVATLVLAIAALATAWSGYQASLWDGIQSSDYSKASALRTEAAQQATTANQYRLADLSVIEGYLKAAADGDDELATFYRERIRAEAKPAFEEWVELDPLENPSAPGTPFTSPLYKLESEEKSKDLNEQASATFARGEDANNYSDMFTLATLVFASALFFAAISERFSYVRARVFLLGLAAACLIGGLVVSFTQPITTG